MKRKASFASVCFVPYMTRIHRLLFLFLAILIPFVAACSADAQTETILYDFNSFNYNGITPYLYGGLIQGTDGQFYGFSSTGGARNAGSVFRITSTGVLTVLHNFQDVLNDGMLPSGSLVEGSDGEFYGTTSEGGDSSGAIGDGVIFKVTSSGVYTILHLFRDDSTPNPVASDGSGPTAGLILGSDGNFYGTTTSGGSAGSGTVFKMTPSGAVTILHSFSAVDSNLRNSDGAHPFASLIQGSDGNFYGTSTFGGSAAGGTAFVITPTGTMTILHTFGGESATNDGSSPYGALVQDADGDFYGTTTGGGTGINDDGGYGEGTVFKMAPSGAVTILHNFGTAVGDGTHPFAGLIRAADGNYYGTAAGYFALGMVGGGTVFKINPTGTLTTLYTFPTASSPAISVDGATPVAPLIQGSDGNFYGTTIQGGPYFSSDNSLMDGYGVLFQLTSPDVHAPIITSLNPGSVVAGGPTFPLTINGSGFATGADVTFGGVPVTVTTQTATQLTVTVPASAIATVATVSVAVTNPNSGTADTKFTVTPPPPPWNVQDVAAVADGTARLLWDRTDGAAGIWIMSAGNTETTVGPTYGPYQGWTAQDIAAAGDGTSRILWNRYDGATGVWAMDAHGNQTSVSPTYGPFSGWKAIDLATAPNGTSRLMWRYTNGEAGILTLNATGGEIIVGRNYGPYTGWTATAVGAAGDGTARMLWTRSDGAMGLWTMDANDLQERVGPTYGPYSDSHGTWRATDLSTSSDGTSQVLWKRSDGAIGVWTFSASDTMTTVGSVYGPYTGFTAAALDAANDKARVLWVRSDRAAGLWSFGSNDVENVIGPVYGPY